jgi:ureidoglycolate amidohydrolase
MSSAIMLPSPIGTVLVRKRNLLAERAGYTNPRVATTPAVESARVNLEVNIDRTIAELEKLATFSDVPAPAVQRVVFTESDLAARKYIIGLFSEAGLKVRTDAVGNIFARWEGTDPTLPPIATGSHTDAIPYSGKYDGTVGVLGGLEAIRALQRSMRAGSSSTPAPRRSIELIMFTSEEPTRFAYGCLGSRLLSGQLTPSADTQLKDEAGATLHQVRTAAGFKGDLAGVKLANGAYSAFVELHIEQGPLLEQAGIPIGAVTAISAPAALRVRYQGPGGHAGGVYMPDRQDPLLAAAALALEVEAAAKELGGRETVGTVGVLDVHPRAVNSIPRDVILEIDVRDMDGPRRDRVLNRIRQSADRFDPPTMCDERIIAAVEKSAADAGHKCQRMISRAYHDTTFMSLVAPVGMIFIPCRDGMSHRPEEYASPKAIKAGLETLAGALAQLAT